MPLIPRFPSGTAVAALVILLLSATMIFFDVGMAVLGQMASMIGLWDPANGWRLATIILALANLKMLPVVWHVRALKGMLEHIIFYPKRFTPQQSAAIFQPIITSSRCVALECDYNLHKSNSTYFSDLDITRAHLVTCLFGGGIAKAWRQPDDGNGSKPGQFMIILGAVHCSFKKEIRPYEPYEMWTRVLSWDQKWLYIVTHFVRKGTVRPKGYTLGPGVNKGWLGGWFGKKHGGGKKGKGARSVTEDRGETLQKAILASAMAKYVIKRGRLTVPPERLIRDSGLLPSEQSSPFESAHKANHDSDDLPWSRDQIEAERRRGLEIAEHFARLDGLHNEFKGDDDSALGEFTDLLPSWW